MGRPVHAFFPVLSPDFPIRLTLRDHVRHGPDSHAVHAGPTGYRVLGRVDGVVRHLACASTHELDRKLDLYSSIAARDLRGRGCRSDWARQVLSPAAAWIKWYLLKGGYRDGSTGRLLAAYAYLYTRQKWRKLRELEARESQPRGCDLSRGETTSPTARRPKRAASTR